MQFRLRSLLIVVTFVAIICGTFAAPPLVALPVLTLILWTSPAFWLSGAFFSRGRRRAFFLGGTLAGIAPYLTVVILSMVWYGEWIDDGDWPDMLNSPDAWETFRVQIAVWLPGVCSLIGGAIGVLSHQLAVRATAEEHPE